MIIVRSPLRVSLLGGGTDLPVFYKRSKGAVISFALDKYIYITINKLAESNDILLKYSKLERVDNIEEIRHPILRSALTRFEVSGVDISITSDIPAGTGLGSSSSFTVGLLRALGEYKGIDFSKEELARIACEIEIDDLQEPIGKQDQYAAAFGGMNHFIFHPNGDVETSALADNKALENLITDSCLLVRIGSVRSSRSILADQSEKVRSGINHELLAMMAEMTNRFCAELPNSVDTLGQLLSESWELKSQLAKGVTNEEIELTLQDAKSHGATGGKLLGAGQSGYALIAFPDRALREIYIDQFPNKSRIVLPGIDKSGCTVIFRSEPR